LKEIFQITTIKLNSLKKIVPFILIILSSTSAMKQDPKTIIFFGDSLAAGYGLFKEQAFPALIEKELKVNGHNIKVVNAGLSGETTAGGLSRIDWILKQKVDIFVLELGSNDALRGLPLAQTKENLQGIINKVKAKSPEAKIIIAGMMAPPNLGENYVTEFKEIFPALAKKNDAVLIPFLLDGVAGDESLNLADGIHPNVEGHKLVAKHVIGFINKLL